MATPNTEKKIFKKIKKKYKIRNIYNQHNRRE